MWFLDLANPGEFASLLFKRCSLGEIDLIVACDRSPTALENLGVVRRAHEPRVAQS